MVFDRREEQLLYKRVMEFLDIYEMFNPPDIPKKIEEVIPVQPKKRISLNYRGEVFQEKVFDSGTQLRDYEHWWKNNFIKSCVECGSIDNLTIDHIIPRAFLKTLGYPVEKYWCLENVQGLCKTCNQGKADLIDKENPKTKVLLQRFLSFLF
jgi:5-methylcytosine-specific restriction endonuclease McrA